MSVNSAATALPIVELAEHFHHAVHGHPIVVVAAPPGSGKTTMVPLFLRDHFPDGEIWIIEPRRIAAVMAAHQVARHLGQVVGDEVGYHIRFASVDSTKTRIRFMTDGVFLRRLVDPRGLRGVAAVCLDEFHERSLAIDLGAWWFRDRISRGDACPRLIILSATLRREQLERYFPEAAWLDAPGQSHPVVVEWGEQHDARPLTDQVVHAVRDALASTSGSILCFLPTIRAIEDAIRAVAPVIQPRGISSFALHGGIPVDEQERAVRRSKGQRVVFSTNIAESSLTVEGVSCVIDSGLARMHHATGAGESRLAVGRISQAACVQRAGRAGREGPGSVIRLFSAFDFSLRPAVELPELMTQEATSVLVWRAALGGRETSTPLLDSPSPEALERARWLLRKWGVMSDDDSLTAMGREIVGLPVEPRLGVLLHWASHHGAAEMARWAVAVLASDDRGRSRSHLSRDRGRSLPFPEIASRVDRCDLSAAIERAFGEGIVQEGGSEITRLVQQLRSNVRGAREGSVQINGSCSPSDDDSLYRAVVVAFPERVAVRRLETDEYLLATGERAVLGKTSRVRGARLIVGIDCLKGEVRPGHSGITITHATPIEEEWLFDLYPDLLSSRTSYEWNDGSQRVEVFSESCFGKAPIETVCRPAQEGDQEAAQILSGELQRRGLRWIFGEDELLSLLGRLKIATISRGPWEGWTIGEDELLAWIVSSPHGKVSHRQITAWIREEKLGSLGEAGTGLDSILGERLGYQWRHELARWCPETIPLPGRPRAAIIYRPGHAPYVASRMQDFFGLTELPGIAGGMIALGIHLLDPRGRTVQVTENLGRFWALHYPTLRRQLQSRYPKHRWPEDPTKRPMT